MIQREKPSSLRLLGSELKLTEKIICKANLYSFGIVSKIHTALSSFVANGLYLKRKNIKPLLTVLTRSHNYGINVSEPLVTF